MPRIRRPRLVPEWRRGITWATTQLGLGLILFGGLSADDQRAAVAWVLDLLSIPEARLPSVLGIVLVVVRMFTMRRGG
jgi:hypothetical protein